MFPTVVLSGLTGGLAAPFIAAGAGAIIGTAGAAALGSTAGIAIIGSVFGVAGAGLTGESQTCALDIDSIDGGDMKSVEYFMCMHLSHT